MKEEIKCRGCEKKVEGRRIKYCSEKCKEFYLKYIKPHEPRAEQQNENYFHEYTTNYARPKGSRGSCGWGIAPNYVWFWTELTIESLMNKAGVEKIKLGNLRIVTVTQARRMINKKNKSVTPNPQIADNTTKR